MLNLKTPHGLTVSVPEAEHEDITPKFDLNKLDEINKYYLENGYVIVKKLFSYDATFYIRSLWDSEIKNYKGYIYRQATAQAERHIKNKNGWIMNPILNLQSLNPNVFPRFRKFATEDILANKNMSNIFERLLSDSPKIVQSMYFEGNSATWEHQDSYYLDAEILGGMCGAWIALEDINASAGRFFICPKSHKTQLDKHGIKNNIAFNHDIYIKSVVKKIHSDNLHIEAPVMKQGDVLFWNSLTVHGSLDSTDSNHSRSSITCHAIPNKQKFLQLQTRLLDLKTEKINQAYIYKPKDLAILHNKIILFVESYFSKYYYCLKKICILILIQFRSIQYK